MSESLPADSEVLTQRPLDRELIVGRMQEYGVGIEPEDLEGEDDGDVLGIIAGYATLYDLDIDEIFPQVLPIENRLHNEDFDNEV